MGFTALNIDNVDQHTGSGKISRDVIKLGLTSIVKLLGI